jgi:hypothetical protein
MARNANGRAPDPAAAVFSCASKRTHDIATAENLQGLPFQRLTERLHARGPRPCAEVLAEALRRLDQADCLAVLALAERIVAWPPGVIRYLGGDWYAPPPLLEVAP